MQGTVLTASATHKGFVRPKNEDACCILQTGDSCPCALIIADGMGGHRRGERASRVAVDYVAAQLTPLMADLRQADLAVFEPRLASIIEKTNVKVYLSSLVDEENEGMGTTLTAALVGSDQVLLAHVGDCRAYRLHQGDLDRLTADHTLVQELVDTGSISQAESEHHPRRHVLTRALGVPDYQQPDLSLHPLPAGDRLLLCSDGLYGMLPDEQIRQVLLTAPDPQTAADLLVELALAEGGEDNITVLLAFV